MRAYFARFNPVRAVNDLRAFLATQKPVHVVFLVIALMLTLLVILGFVIDARVEQPYKPDIVYFQNWRADRSEAEIRAAQRHDMAVKTRRDAQIDAYQANRQAQFKRLDDKLEKWGF